MKILAFLLFALLFVGCSAKPEVITKTIYKDVYVPVKCQVKMPKKPKFEPENLSSAKELAVYYRQVEALLMECVK